MIASLILAANTFLLLQAQTTPQNVDLIIQGGVIITMDAERTIVEDGFLAIAGSRIVAVGPRADLASRYRADKVVPAQGKLVLPGLINLHTHSFMILFRGLADNYTLDTWTQILGPLHQANDDRPGFRRWGNYLACLEMIKRGTTTFVEMYHYPELAAEAAANAGLRAIVTQRLPFDRSTGAFDATRAETVFRKLLENWQNHVLVTPGLAAHAPHTVPTEVLRASKELADRYEVPLVVHLAEGPTETELIQRKFGKSPTAFLEELGFLSSRVLAVHSVQLSDEDIDILKRHRVGIAHCPESNAKLGVGIARVPDLLREGINVGLGTDSGVSNNNLDMFEEMDTAVKLQRAIHRDWKALTAREVLEMATIRGAAAIGMDTQIGSLEKGKKADIIIVDADRVEMQPIYDYYSHLVYVVKGGNVETSIVDGRPIMERGKVLTLDVAQIREKTDEYGRHVSESMKEIIANRPGATR